MRYPRADWAANVPWAGITGKPANLDTSSIEFSQLRAQIANIQASLNGNGSTTAQQWISEDVSLTIGTLDPLQATSETYSVPAIDSGTPVIVNQLSENLWLMSSCYCVEDGVVRVIVQNVGPYQVTPGTINLRITYLANA